MKNEVVPRLRFKGFKNRWKKIFIKDLFKITRGHVLPKKDISQNKTNLNKYPVYSSQTKNNGLLGYYTKYLYKDAITWTTDGANAGTVRFHKGKFYSTNVNGVLLSNKGYDNNAIAEAINLVAFKYVSHVGNSKLMNNVMATIPIMITSISEQQQISNFFATLDKLIQLQQKKVALLKKLKKAYLQKMFPHKDEDVPRLRFKGFHGKWRQVTVNDISDYKNGHSLEKLANNTNNSSNTKIIINLNSISIDGTLKDSGRRLTGNFKDTLKKNDLVMILSDLAHGNLIGLTAIIPKNNTYVLNQRVGLLRFNKNINSVFMHYLFNSIQRFFHRMSAGTSQLNLFKRDILRTQLLIPSLDEQTKISSFLNHLDNNINNYREKLNYLRKLKKAYLQKMFC